jgi:hypothetical protein
MFSDEKVVVDTMRLVVTDSKLTTTQCAVVRKIMTIQSIWSLLLLTTEPITTTNDHRIMVVNNF